VTKSRAERELLPRAGMASSAYEKEHAGYDVKRRNQLDLPSSVNRRWVDFHAGADAADKDNYGRRRRRNIARATAANVAGLHADSTHGITVHAGLWW